MALSDWSEPDTVYPRVVQDLGDAAHAGTAHADEVDVLDGVFHALCGHQLVEFIGHALRRLRARQRVGSFGHGQQGRAMQ